MGNIAEFTITGEIINIIGRQRIPPDAMMTHSNQGCRQRRVYHEKKLWNIPKIIIWSLYNYNWPKVYLYTHILAACTGTNPQVNPRENGSMKQIP